MKKTFLLIAGLFSLSIIGSAQTLTIKNNTPCSFFMDLTARDAPACGIPSLLSPYGPGGPLAMSAFSTAVVSTTDYTGYDPAHHPIWYPEVAHFAGAISPAGAPNLGAPCTGLPTTIQVTVGTCGPYTATWNSLGGGNAQVEIY